MNSKRSGLEEVERSERVQTMLTDCRELERFWRAISAAAMPAELLPAELLNCCRFSNKPLLAVSAEEKWHCCFWFEDLM